MKRRVIGILAKIKTLLSERFKMIRKMKLKRIKK